MASWLVRSTPERIGFEPWVESLCCILRQDTLLSQCLSPLRCINGYRQIKRDKVRPDESLGVHADFTFYLLCVFQVECSNCANLENKAQKWRNQYIGLKYKYNRLKRQGYKEKKG